jgi:hypothetical protein
LNRAQNYGNFYRYQSFRSFFSTSGMKRSRKQLLGYVLVRLARAIKSALPLSLLINCFSGKNRQLYISLFYQPPEEGYFCHAKRSDT